MSTTARGGGGLAHVRSIRAFWGCPSFWRCVHRLDLAFELRGGSGWHQDGDGPRAAASAERTTNRLTGSETFLRLGWGASHAEPGIIIIIIIIIIPAG